MTLPSKPGTPPSSTYCWQCDGFGFVTYEPLNPSAKSFRETCPSCKGTGESSTEEDRWTASLAAMDECNLSVLDIIEVDGTVGQILAPLDEDHALVMWEDKTRSSCRISDMKLL